MKKYEYLHQLLREWRHGDKPQDALRAIVQFMDDNPEPHMLSQDMPDPATQEQGS